MIRNLPSHEFVLPTGLVTNFNRESVAGRALLQATNVDGYEVFGAIGKVPGSTVVSPTLSAAVKSLHYFEYFDLDSQLQRAIIALANGALRTYTSETSWGTLTLPTGYTVNTNEALVDIRQNDRLHLSGPNQWDFPSGGVKYDGSRVTPWGVVAPGLDETILEDFNSSTTLTASTDASLSDSTTTIDGGGGTQVNKTGTATTTAYAQTGSAGTPLNLDVSGAGQDTGYVWLFLPSGVLQTLATSGTVVEVQAGDGNLTNANRYQFTVGDLFPGWNLLSWTWSAPDATAGSGATLSDIDAIQFIYNTAVAGTTVSGVVWDKCYTVSEGAPTVATGGASNPSGTYTYVITYATEYGLESNAGPASASVSPSSQEVDLTAIPVSSDDQVIERRIYRDISGDAIYRYVGSIYDNVTTTFTDTLADSSLDITTQPPFAGDTVSDNSPPGRLLAAVLHQNRVVGIDPDSRFILKISEQANPEAFRLVDQLTLEDELTALENHAFGTLLYATDKLFLLTGDGINEAFNVQEVTDQIGANGRRTVCKAKGINVTVREGEVFLVAQPSDPWFLNGPVLDQFKALSAATLDDMIVFHDRSRLRVLFFVAGGDDAYVWQYGIAGASSIQGEDSAADPLDLRSGSWWKLTFPTGYDVDSVALVERTADSPELWVGGADGRVYWIQDTSTATWANGDSTEAISTTIETHAVPLGDGPGGRGEPRFLQIHGTADTSTDWTVTVEVFSDADGPSIGSTSFTVTLSGGDDSPIVPVPSLGVRGNWCRVTLANATTGGEGLIKKLRLFYIPRVDFQGVRAS